MVTSAAGREYRSHDLSEDKSFRAWTCSECGCLVGPLVRNRDDHDAWHERATSSR